MVIAFHSNSNRNPSVVDRAWSAFSTRPMTEAEFFQLAVETVISGATVGLALGLLLIFIRKK